MEPSAFCEYPALEKAAANLQPCPGQVGKNEHNSYAMLTSTTRRLRGQYVSPESFSFFNPIPRARKSWDDSPTRLCADTAGKSGFHFNCPSESTESDQKEYSAHWPGAPVLLRSRTRQRKRGANRYTTGHRQRMRTNSADWRQIESEEVKPMEPCQRTSQTKSGPRQSNRRKLDRKAKDSESTEAELQTSSWTGNSNKLK